MRLIAILLVGLLAGGCGGSDEANPEQEIRNLLYSANAYKGFIARPADNELPLLIHVTTQTAGTDYVLSTLAGIEAQAGYPLTRVANPGEKASIVISPADSGCVSAIPHHNWQNVTIKVGDLTQPECKEVTADLFAYKLLGLNRVNIDNYHLLKNRTATADRAIATLYNNQPGTAVDQLKIH